MDKERFQILSLDGGGIKGVFSAAVLAFLEDDLKTEIISHFDLIVGTSTGGLIALGLGLGLSPMEILEFYKNEGANMFSQNRANNIKQYFQNKYKPDPLEKALRAYFKDSRLADSKKRLVIPSYNLGEDDVYLFKTPHNKRLRRDYKIPMWKAGMATSAAPTYFPSFRKVDSTRLIDGGVWANNPAMVGIIEAISLLDVKLENIHVLSLGTTDEIKERPDELDEGGLWQWRRSAVEVIMRGQSIGVTAQAVHLLGKENVERFDPAVPEGLFKLDRLKIDALIGKAADKSRHFSPIFEQKFMKHIASVYIPIYS